MARYTLTLTDTADANVQALAVQTGQTVQQLLRNALNVYGTLKRAEHEEIFVKTRVDGKLIVKRVELP